MPSPLEQPDLRALVAAVVREVVSQSPVAATPAVRVEHVRIAGDEDLQGFARRMSELFSDADVRADVREGRLQFRLENPPQVAAAPVAASAATPGAHRIDRGAVTERQVNAAADAGASLLLGPRAVMTPLAKERARALGVSVEKERR